MTQESPASPLLLRKLSISRKTAYILTLLLMAFIFDISRMPDQQISSRILLFGITGYQRFISPRLKGFITCKFEPTCSHYGATSIRWYGTYWGGIRALNRLFRCSPWTSQSGWDPP